MNTVAMLIDWENIKGCAAEYLGTVPDIVTLKKITRQYGKLTIARAYANWTDPSGWHTGDVERLAAQGIEPVFVWTRRDDAFNEQPTFVNDMADLRLACDCMELLAMHPEISCYVIVSGDGALETVMAKLSAYGKRTVRIAVEKGLAKGMHVLGEERVLYDDWVRGFKMTVSAGPLQNALEQFVEAVTLLRSSGTDNGLQSVKEVMRRKNPKFEEEQLGIPSFRHLAYLAEARGLVRIDSRYEPARAYLPNEEKATDGSWLATGTMWLELIRKLDPTKEYKRDAFNALLDVPEDNRGNTPTRQARISISMALKSDVIAQVFKNIVMKSKEPNQVTADVSTSQLRLNAHHPRVQVALAVTAQQPAH